MDFMKRVWSFLFNTFVKLIQTVDKFGYSRIIFVYGILGNKKVYKNVLNYVLLGIPENIEHRCYRVIVSPCDFKY